jgi:hypothetical protein
MGSDITSSKLVHYTYNVVIFSFGIISLIGLVLKGLLLI